MPPRGRCHQSGKKHSLTHQEQLREAGCRRESTATPSQSREWKYEKTIRNRKRFQEPQKSAVWSRICKKLLWKLSLWGKIADIANVPCASLRYDEAKLLVRLQANALYQFFPILLTLSAKRQNSKYEGETDFKQMEQLIKVYGLDQDEGSKVYWNNPHELS